MNQKYFSHKIYCSKQKVKWVRDSIDKYMNFYSVSGDGLVQRWTIVTGILLPTDMFDMPFTKKLENFNHYSELTNLKGITRKIEVIYFPHIHY